MKDILTFLEEEGISEKLLEELRSFRSFYKLEEEDEKRLPKMEYLYYGKEIWEAAIAALLSGANLLLDGPKATGKNVLAQGLALAFSRPEWDISLYVNSDASSLVGSDTFSQGEVKLRKGPILECALHGGFGILDEINMAKNESLAVLHATLDFRHSIDLPGYGQFPLHEATRLIGTMNYGDAGTREVNEALASRFLVLHMPVISAENLDKLLQQQFPNLSEEYRKQFALLFSEIQEKVSGGEISSRSLDLRGLISSIKAMQKGLSVSKALEMGLVNKSFDLYERQLVQDLLDARIPKELSGERIFL